MIKQWKAVRYIFGLTTLLSLLGCGQYQANELQGEEEGLSLMALGGTAPVARFHIVDSNTDQVVMGPFGSGAKVDVSAMKDFNVVAQFPRVSQVRYDLKRFGSQTENIAPYAACTDINGNYANCRSKKNMKEGVVTLSATAYSGSAVTDRAQLTLVLSSDSKDDAPDSNPLPDAGSAKALFRLINSSTNQVLRSGIESGSSLDLSQISSFNIDVEFENVTYNQVKYEFSNGASQTENVVPYAACGDSNANYNNCRLAKDIQSETLLSAQAFFNNQAVSDKVTLNLKLTGSTTPDPQPSPDPEPTPAPVPDDSTDPGNGGGEQGPILLTGELKRYHKLSLTFEGPQASEKGTPNPFTDYRLEVAFQTPSGKVIRVPGHFAADGNAANSGATSGNKWRVRFLPREKGEYRYVASFRKGAWVAISTASNSGLATSFDGTTGSFVIKETDKIGRDHRAKGKLKYVGKRYLQFDSGEYFVKAGSDAPENLLAYGEFDQTPNKKDFAEHVKHFNSGDPTWKSGKGKGLVGAINYLHNQGMNAFSFLPMNINGDGKDVWPYISSSSADRHRFDVSKMDQWEIVFDHADKKGMYLHFKTQETENDGLLDNGLLGNYRKLYYRELVSRFAHHHAMNWNLGEEWDRSTEISQTTENLLAGYSEYFRTLDPYDNHIVVHTYPGSKDQIYSPVSGRSDILTGASLQSGVTSVYKDTLNWVIKSLNAGHPWVVANDEQGDAQTGVAADASYSNNGSKSDNRDAVRKDVLWGNLMAGGAGVEYYFGYATGCTDLTCDDFSSRHTKWQDAQRALEFFNRYLPFEKLQPRDVGGHQYQMELPGKIYVVFNKNGGSTTVNASSGTYDIRWFRAKHVSSDASYALKTGSKVVVSGGGTLNLGSAPFSGDSVALVVAKGYSYNANRPGHRVDLSESSSPSSPGPAPAPAPVSCTNDTKVFQPNGQQQIVIEAESVAAKGKWQKRSDISGATGSGFLVYLADEFKPNLGSHGFDGQSELIYRFEIKEAGTYTLDYRGARYSGGQSIKMCGSHDTSCCPNSSNTCTRSDLNNDIYIGTTGKSPTKAYLGVGSSQNSWRTGAKFDDSSGHYTPKVSLGVGVHQLVVRGRSNMLALDKLMIFKGSKPTATAQESGAVCK